MEIKCAIYARYSSNNQREASIEDVKNLRHQRDGQFLTNTSILIKLKAEPRLIQE